MSPPASPPETIGRYRILGVIARGSVGRVYRARDPHTDREVALKVMMDASELDSDGAGQLRARFLLEARAAGRLSHPGIVAVYDADVDPESGSPFLVMELVEGRSLGQLLRERGHLPWHEAAAIGAAVALALDHAHERGIVHRDVKPGNVLLTADGRVKVTDFGIAKLIDESHTLAGSVLGTPSFISPEQLRGEPFDGRSDLFGLGALLYRMLTGLNPFRGESVPTIIHKVLSVEPEPPTRVRPDLPAVAEEIVLRALEKDPAARFQSGRELAAALNATLDPETPAGAPPRATSPASSAPPPPAREGRRLRLPAFRARRAAIAAPLLILALLAAGFWLGRREASPQRDSAPREVAAIEGSAGPAISEPGPEAIPAAPIGREAPAPPPPSPAVEPEAEAQLEASDETATIRILYRNRLRNGRMTVWVDGERAWTTALEAPKGPRSLFAGETIRATIPVGAGPHDVEVRIAQSSARIDSRGVIHGEFAPGQRRALRVVLIPYVTRLKLDWES